MTKTIYMLVDAYGSTSELVWAECELFTDFEEARCAMHNAVEDYCLDNDIQSDDIFEHTETKFRANDCGEDVLFYIDKKEIDL